MSGTLFQLAQATPPREGLTAVISPYMGVFFAAFFASIFITPLMRRLAMRNGIVDWPDLKRKNHTQPVAYLGGVAIFLGWLAGIAFSFSLLPHNQQTISLAEIFPLSVVLGAAAITLTGLIDDVYGMAPRVKVGGQLFAAAALAHGDVGVRLVDAAFHLIHVPCPDLLVYILGTAVIAVFVIGGCNAMNLLDGLDGLAAGVAAIACFGFLLIAAIVASQGMAPTTLGGLTDPVRLIVCLAALGAVLGFLPYNFNPATIFMGDAGSLLLGYLSVSTILLFTLVSREAAPGAESIAVDPDGSAWHAMLLVTASLIVFALPITDTCLAIVRRKLQGKPISEPDNQHLHHLLRRSGLSVKQSVLVMYGVAVLFAAIGVTLVALELRWRYILAAAAVLFGFIMVTAFKYGQNLALQEGVRAGAATPTPDPPLDASPSEADTDAELPHDEAEHAPAGTAASGPAAHP